MKNKALQFLCLVCLIFSNFLFPSEKILYHSKKAGTVDIWMCNPDGSEQQQVTKKPGDEWHPRISPDGTELLYSYFEPGSTLSSMWIMDIDGAYDYKVDVGKDVYSVCWSPDGKKLLYFHKQGHWRGRMYVVDKDGSNDHVLLEPFSPYTQVDGLDWKGNKILFYASRSHSGNNRIFIMKDDGTNIIKLTEHHGDLGRFNNNASKISYFNIANINVMNSDGSGKYTVATGIHRTGLAPFSPDGTKLAFSSFGHDSFKNDIYTINIDGSDSQRITFTEDISYVWDWANIKPCSFGPEDQPLSFQRKKGKPQRKYFEWDSCGGFGMIVIKNDTVSSAFVLLNGEQIAVPSDFNQNSDCIESEIELIAGKNLLEVEIRGKPGEELLINFEELK